MSSHRTGAGATINPDNIKMFYATAVGVGIVFAASVITSSFGLYAVGLAQGLPPEIAWVTPVMIDSAILVFTAVALIMKRRGNTFGRFYASAGVGLATLLSVGLNFLHSYYAIGVASLEAATGTLVNSIAPLFIWITTEMLVMLVTKQAPAPRQPSAAPKRAAGKSRSASSKPKSGGSGKSSGGSSASRPAKPKAEVESRPRPTPAALPTSPESAPVREREPVFSSVPRG